MRDLKISLKDDFIFTGPKQLNQFNINDHWHEITDNGTKLHMKISLRRNPSYLLINSYLPSLFTMMMTIVPLFLDENIHFNTTIMLVLTAQLCLYTLLQSSLQDVPKTEYLKLIDYWNMFVMTISLTNFFILFLWEIVPNQTKSKSILKQSTLIVIPLVTVTGFSMYWIVCGLIYFEIV